MRLAVISDIHANREALDAVLNSVDNRSVDSILCLGDLVDYGVDFEYCIDAIRNRTDVCLLGNHDSTVIGRDPLTNINREARRSAQWTMGRMQKAQKSYLENLPMTYSLNDMFLVHSSPVHPQRWNYVTNWFDAAGQFDNFPERFCFVGHSHIPAVFDEKNRRNSYGEGVLSLNRDSRYIVNVGSVGQPRDGDPRACYMVVEDQTDSVEFVRVPYDTQKASRKIASTGVSLFHARRILLGI